MALTYTQAKATLDEMADRVNNARKRAEAAYSQYLAAQAELGGMAALYGPFITELNAAATAVSWPQAPAQKVEKDQMVSDFQALKTSVDNIIAAIDAV